MPIYTPRGLKLRLSRQYAFGLMSRLYKKETAFRVLQLTEDVENLDAFGATVATTIALFFNPTPIELGLVACLSALSFKVIHAYGLYVLPVTLLLPFARVYSILSGRGIFLIPLCIACWIVGGWPLILAYFSGRLVASIVGHLREMYMMKRMHSEAGFTLTASERSFFHAFRILARKHGLSEELSLTDSESSDEFWHLSYDELAFHWPVVVSRFSDDK